MFIGLGIGLVAPLLLSSNPNALETEDLRPIETEDLREVEIEG